MANCPFGLSVNVHVMREDIRMQAVDQEVWRIASEIESLAPTLS
jgi:hypothetical protein